MNASAPAATNINTTRTAIGMESPVFGAVCSSAAAFALAVVVVSEVLAAAVVVAVVEAVVASVVIVSVVVSVL